MFSLLAVMPKAQTNRVRMVTRFRVRKMQNQALKMTSSGLRFFSANRHAKMALICFWKSIIDSVMSISPGRYIYIYIIYCGTLNETQASLLHFISLINESNYLDKN